METTWIPIKELTQDLHAASFVLTGTVGWG
jgi:hypothetical protein